MVLGIREQFVGMSVSHDLGLKILTVFGEVDTVIMCKFLDDEVLVVLIVHDCGHIV